MIKEGKNDYIIPSVWESDSRGSKSSDIYSKLLEKRIIFLNGMVDQVSTNIIVASLLYLEAQNDEDIWIYINSEGGEVMSGLQVIDVMRYIRPKVGTVVTGLAASMGCMIAAAGHPGMRLALPHAQIMAHQVSSGTSGLVTDMEVDLAHTKHLNKLLMDLLSQYSGMPITKLMKEVDRDKWLTAQDALKFGSKGLIDEIVVEHKIKDKK